MTRRVVILLALGWIVLGASPALAANILTNPGFETGALSPWFQDFNGTPTEPEDWNVTGADAHSGAFSATVIGNKSIRQDFAPVSTDDIVEFSYWLKQPEFAEAFSALELFYSDASTGFGTCVTVFDASGWGLCDMTSDLTPAKNLVGFSVFGFQGGGDAEDRTFLDDATIDTTAALVPGPRTLVFLGVGLAALGAIRRRTAASSGNPTTTS
jgi:hypothetical protein